MKNESSESDFLKYRDDHRPLPLAIRVAWFIFFVFCALYLMSFAIPDLKVWLAK